MKRFNCMQLIRTVCVLLISIASLYGISTTANASFFPQQSDQACMAEQAGFDLNCTANDIRVSKVDMIENLDGTTPVECVLGQDVTFRADVTITTTANKRFDYSVYLPEGSYSAQDSNPANECSILLGQNDGPGVDLESGLDACADISKAAGFDETHLYENAVITMFCRDDDNSGKAEFNYCMAWHNKDGADCSELDPAAPGTPSKCRCDAFDIDVFIRPDPPDVDKTLLSTNTRTEPGGLYNFMLSFQNPNSQTSIFLTSLTDKVDKSADGSFETSLDLWGSLDSIDPQDVEDGLVADGVYLTSSNCSQPANGGEILPSGSYSCEFSVYVVATNLPDDQSPEYFDDVILLALVDKNDDPVAGNHAECPVSLGAVIGEHCSDKETVNVTNLPPTISVLKTANPGQVPESGGNVTYTVEVTNTSATWDSPLTLTSLMDNQFGDLDGAGSCSTGGSIAYGATYSCSFVEFISGSGAGSHMNTVTAKAIDNESDEATANESETVIINDVPSSITLEKTADPIEVLETGDDPAVTRTVDYTFEFAVDGSGVDTVTFATLMDNKFGDLTADCWVDTVDDGPITPEALAGFMLDPGQTASCTIALELTGDADDVHVNLATIDGTDEDGQPVQDMDDATVTFIPADPATDMKFAASLLVVIELTNAGIENVNLTAINVDGENVFANAFNAGFRLFNSGGMFDSIAYPACAEDHELTYNGSPDDTYACAFTIEYIPGLENTDPINALNDIIVEVTDDEGEVVSNQVTVLLQTVENP